MVQEYPNKISWKNIAKAVAYYEGTASFNYIEVPWLAPEEIMKITFDGPSRFKTELGNPIGSGEQSFLHLQFNGKLKPGRYMTVTPCFRDEDENEFHKRQFIKLELYITSEVSLMKLQETINWSQLFFSDLLKTKVEQVDMGDGTFDLKCKGIELGSYGIKEHNDHKWIYGTGIAEPRTSQVDKLKLSSESV